MSGLSQQHLKSFILRIERLEEEKKALSADIREVYSEAKSSGFDPKIMRKAIALRKLDAAERQEMEALIDVYMDAIEGTPLGQAAVATAKEGAAEKVRAGRSVIAALADAVKNDPKISAMAAKMVKDGTTMEIRADGKRTLVDKDGVHEFDADTGEAIPPRPKTQPTDITNHEQHAAQAAANDGLDIPGFLWRGPPRDQHEQALEC